MPRPNPVPIILLSHPSRLDANLRALEEFFGKLVPVPSEWLTEASESPDNRAVVGLTSLKCESYAELTRVWRKALKWTESLDNALAAMLACAVSTPLGGNQLWLRVLSQASGGKSTLCEGLSVCRRYVLPKSTIRGFFSGFKSKEGEDNSLVAKMDGKTLVTKDGDTLLRAPNLSQILSEARDIYDGQARTHFRNKVSRDYELRTTWILCGTASLLSLDQSELGERFLTCIIEMDEEAERAAAKQAVYREDRSSSMSSFKAAEASSKEETLAKRMTGGYVEYLRVRVSKLVEQVGMTDAIREKCVDLGTFVAYMRSRPSTTQTEVFQRELSPRLSAQHLKLAKCLAIVLGKTTVDEEVMRKVQNITLDSSRGVILDISKALYGKGSLQARRIAELVGVGDELLQKLLRFMDRLGMVENERVPMEGLKGTIVVWRLSERIRSLYSNVVG